MSRISLLPGLALACALACGPADTQSNVQSASEELAALYAADQADRQPPAVGSAPLNMDSVIAATLARDSVRRARVRHLVSAGALRTPDDYHHAGIVILHQHDSSSYKEALELASTGLAIDSLHRGVGFLAATASDNLRSARGEPRWYGIAVRGGLANPPVILPFDSTKVTDAERIRLGMEPLAVQLANAEAQVRNWSAAGGRPGRRMPAADPGVPPPPPPPQDGFTRHAELLEDADGTLVAGIARCLHAQDARS